MKSRYLFVFQLCFICFVYGQEQLITSFLYENIGIYNPAWQENATFSVGLTGTTMANENDLGWGNGAVSFQYINKNALGLGTKVLTTHTPMEEEWSVFADMSKSVHFGKKVVFAYGLRLSGTSYERSQEASTYFLEKESNRNPSHQKFTPNFGLGVMLTVGDYYLGISAPRTVPYEQVYVAGLDGFMVGKGVRYFFNGGGKLNLYPNWVLKVDFQLVPTEMELVENYGIRLQRGNRYDIGLAIGTNAFAGLTKIRISDGLGVGYAYRHNKSGVNVINGKRVTHELFCSITLK